MSMPILLRFPKWTDSFGVMRNCYGRDHACMVVGFTTTHAISTYDH